MSTPAFPIDQNQEPITLSTFLSSFLRPTFEYKTMGMDEFIESVVDSCLPKNDTLLTSIVLETLKKRPMKPKNQMNPLFHLCISQVIKNRIREESTAFIWYKLFCHEPLDIIETAERIQDDGYLKPETSLEGLLQSIDRLALQQSLGFRYLKNDAKLMAKVLEQNLERDRYREITIIVKRDRCQVKLDHKIVVDATHPDGTDYSTRLGSMFARIAFSKKFGFTDIEIHASNAALEMTLMDQLLTNCGMVYQDDKRIEDPELMKTCTIFFYCHAGRRSTFSNQAFVLGDPILLSFDCIRRAYFW